MSPRDSNICINDVVPAKLIEEYGGLDVVRPGGFCDRRGVVHPTLRAAGEAEIAYIKHDYPPPLFIYFIQAGPKGSIKIGKAKDPWKRTRGIQTGCPVKCQVIAVMPGGSDDERELHRAFAEYREHGEWFRPCAAIRAKINEVRREHKRWQDLGPGTLDTILVRAKANPA